MEQVHEQKRMNNIEILTQKYKNKENAEMIDLCFNTISGNTFNEYIALINDNDTKSIKYSDMVKINKELVEDVAELKNNYWNLHKFLKIRN
jgi:hypothetical protein